MQQFQHMSFNSSSDGLTISVTFHMILPEDAWKWNSEIMHVCISFGDQRLCGGLMDSGVLESRE